MHCLGGRRDERRCSVSSPEAPLGMMRRVRRPRRPVTLTESAPSKAGWGWPLLRVLLIAAAAGIAGLHRLPWQATGIAGPEQADFSGPTTPTWWGSHSSLGQGVRLYRDRRGARFATVRQGEVPAEIDPSDYQGPNWSKPARTIRLPPRRSPMSRTRRRSSVSDPASGGRRSRQPSADVTRSRGLEANRQRSLLLGHLAGRLRRLNGRRADREALHGAAPSNTAVLDQQRAVLAASTSRKDSWPPQRDAAQAQVHLAAE